jgi:hypothetical protein
LNARELQEIEAYLTPAERAELDELIAADIAERPWIPLPGPQTMAYESLADVIGYGGAAGGGKTALACGKAMTQHRRAAIFRREGTQLTGILDYLTDLANGSRDGYNSREKIWRGFGPQNAQIEFGSVPNAGDEKNYQGRPKDLLVLDEATNLLEPQARFLMGWVRTTVPGQRCQTLMTFNPPTDSDGRWVIGFFAPWLDKKHPLYPALPGQLLYVATIDGKDDWSYPNDARRFVLKAGQRLYEFAERDYPPTEIITPQSRTFIPSRITDNPYLYGTGYMTQLQAMPEPLRSQMLNGDFEAGMQDGAFQVIPTAWVDIAMKRWTDMSPKPPMDSLGIDVARGGRDNTVLMARHGMWFDKPNVTQGSASPDGPTVAGLAIARRRDNAVMHIDVIGVGASPYDFLVEANQDVVGVNVSTASNARDKSGALEFYNLRTELIWRMREALDPEANNGIALPPDPRLLADLCAFTWKLKGRTIYVESREEVEHRIKRSPDFASAAFLALMDTPKRQSMINLMAGGKQRGYQHDHDPMACMQPNARSEYDPTGFHR